ncbi:MAG: hypothetical protein K8S27_13480 [Candidatus Omnitrophica bacterium]|nr:hypothetical protein [Candidatus Omnitrophota bacterium]
MFKRLYDQHAQNMVEYLLVFTAVLMVLIMTLGPSGVITSEIKDSIELSVNAIGVMARCVCYDADGTPCAPIANDGCCFPGTPPGIDPDCQAPLVPVCNNDGFCGSQESCACSDCSC